MPNWTQNELEITGDVDSISRLKELVKEGDEVFSFNKIIPMPRILENTAFGSTTIDGERLTSWHSEPDRNSGLLHRAIDRKFTDDEKAILSLIGFSNAYEWQVYHWEVKWGACEPRIVSENVRNITYAFETPWTESSVISKKLKELFPRVTVEHRFSYEGEYERHVTIY